MMFLSSCSTGQLSGRRVQVPNRCGFVPGLDLPGRTCIPAWWGDWTVTVLECKYIKHSRCSYNVAHLRFGKSCSYCKPVLCLTGHLKKGARLELSLVHQLFNLGNNKNIKWIPVFLCYNRSTTEWTRRDSETKPMTSERNKRVEEEESTNRRQGDGKRGRVNKREAGTAVRAKWRREVEKMAACGRAAERNRGEISTVSWESEWGSTPNKQNPAYPFNPQLPGKEGTLSYLQMGSEGFQLNLKNLFSKLAGSMITESHRTGYTKSPC